MTEFEKLENLYSKAENLFINTKRVDTYKEMCKLLEETDYSYHQDLKKKQLKKWKMCFTWRKEGQNFTCFKMKSKDSFNEAL